MEHNILISWGKKETLCVEKYIIEKFRSLFCYIDVMIWTCIDLHSFMFRSHMCGDFLIVLLMHFLIVQAKQQIKKETFWFVSLYNYLLVSKTFFKTDEGRWGSKYTLILYGCSTWILTKFLEKKPGVKYAKMLLFILNKCWKQNPTKQQLYGHLPPIS